MASVAEHKSVVWTGIALIAVTGLIHLVEAPEYFEVAAYLGLLFVANVLAAAVAAYGIYRGLSWGWGLGVVAAGGAAVAYIISRTIGLPGLSGEEFFEPLGIISLLVEAIFVVLAAITARN